MDTSVMPTSFRAWELASGLFFLYTGGAAFAVPGLSGPRRGRVLAGSAAGFALAGISAVVENRGVLHTWLLPPALLLLGYWTSGALFVEPMPAVERLLRRTDGALAVRDTAAAIPRIIAELLECAYSAVYALIPLALALHLGLGRAPNPERFWTIVLVTDYLCFAALAWIQTRPPRALEPGEPWCASCRGFNLRLLGATSVQVNTFPSGHAAEALAAALLVADTTGFVFAAMLVAALAVSAGAVYGRYHYALDAITGWIVAVSVWSAFT
jgi:membrane-associated phospholipid phosphatase